MSVIDFHQIGDAIFEYRTDGYVYCQIVGSDQWHPWTTEKIAPADWPRIKQSVF